MRAWRVQRKPEARELASEVAAKVAEVTGVATERMFDGRHREGDAVTARSLFFYVMHLRWMHSFPELEALTNFADATIRELVLACSDRLKHERELQSMARACGV